MKLVVVDELPKRTRVNNPRKSQKDRVASKNLYEFFDEFLAMNVKVVLVDITSTDYSCTHSAHNSFRRSLDCYSYPIDAKMRNGKVYLVRTDM